MEIRVLKYFLAVAQEGNITRAAELTLSAEECAYLEEGYLPHALVGVMAQNTAAAKEKHVWGVAARRFEKSGYC